MLEGQSGPVSGRAAHKRRIALLAVLAAARGRPVGRERLIGLLWAEHASDAARHLLSESLYVLRKELGEAVLVGAGDEVALPHGVLHCDVTEFEAALEAGDAERAVSLYQGPFLEGFYVADAPEFERWAEAERERLARGYSRTVEALAEREEQNGNYLEAAEWWRRLSAADPFSSRVSLRRVRALDRAGERGAALRVAAAHIALLREELGVAPDVDFSSFFEELRAQAAQASTPDRISVPTSVARISDELGDTVPSASVSSSGESSSRRLQPDTGGTGTNVRHWQKWVCRGGVAGLILGLLLSAVNTPPESPGRPEPLRIAVLNFDVYGPEPELQALAGLLTDRLIDELAHVRALRVISRMRINDFRHRRLSLDSVASELGVSRLVTGSIRRSGNTYRVTVRLVDAQGEQLESKQVEEQASELFALEDRVAVEVATFLRQELGSESRTRERRAATRSGEAYRLVVQAEDLHERAAGAVPSAHALDIRATKRLLNNADSLLIRAEELDRGWLQPIIDRGFVALAFAQLSASAVRDSAYLAALSHARRALSTDPRNAGALELRGTALWLAATQSNFMERTKALDDAERDLRQAVQHDSSRASAWSTLGQLLVYQGSVTEAAWAIDRALDADAFLADVDHVLFNRFLTALVRMNYAEARGACERGHRMFPRDYRFWDCQLTLLREDPAAPVDTSMAWRLVAELEKVDPPAKARASGHPYSPTYRRIVAATISARAGDTRRARAELARARRETAHDPVLQTDLLYDEAYLQVVLGDTVAGRALLARYVTAHPELRTFIERDPLFASIRPKPAGEGTLEP